MSLLLRTVSAVGVLAVFMAAACGGDGGDTPDTTTSSMTDSTNQSDPTELLTDAEILDDVTVELQAAADHTATVTIRNQRSEGIALVEPVPGLLMTVGGDAEGEALTDLYVRPLEGEGEGEGGGSTSEEPVRHVGVAVAAGDSFELDRALLVEPGVPFKVCIEAATFPGESSTGEEADFPARQASERVVLVCSETAELGDA